MSFTLVGRRTPTERERLSILGTLSTSTGKEQTALTYAEPTAYERRRTFGVGSSLPLKPESKSTVHSVHLDCQRLLSTSKNDISLQAALACKESPTVLSGFERFAQRIPKELAKATALKQEIKLRRKRPNVELREDDLEEQDRDVELAFLTPFLGDTVRLDAVTAAQESLTRYRNTSPEPRVQRSPQGFGLQGSPPTIAKSVALSNAPVLAAESNGMKVALKTSKFPFQSLQSNSEGYSFTAPPKRLRSTRSAASRKGLSGAAAKTTNRRRSPSLQEVMSEIYSMPLVGSDSYELGGAADYSSESHPLQSAAFLNQISLVAADSPSLNVTPAAEHHSPAQAFLGTQEQADLEDALQSATKESTSDLKHLSVSSASLEPPEEQESLLPTTAAPQSPSIKRESPTGSPLPLKGKAPGKRKPAAPLRLPPVGDDVLITFGQEGPNSALVGDDSFSFLLNNFSDPANQSRMSSNTSMFVGGSVRQSKPGRSGSQRADDEERKKLLEVELERLGKYRWLPDDILKPFMSMRVNLHKDFLHDFRSMDVGTLPKPNLRPHLNPPTLRIALVVSVGSYDDPTLSPYPQAEIDGETLVQCLLKLGYDVTHLTSRLEDPFAVEGVTPTELIPHQKVLATKDAVLREMSRCYQMAEMHLVASLLVVFIGRGTTHSALDYSDEPQQLFACCNTKANLHSTYVPAEVLLTLTDLSEVLVAGDFAPLTNGPGYGFVSSSIMGGRLQFEYPPETSFRGWYDAKKGALTSLLVRGFRGKAARDLHLTPNNLNVFIANRLMALKWKLYTSASPWQTGKWDLASRDVLYDQRQDVRAFRQSKRKMWCAFKAFGVILEHSSRNMQTLTSQILTKVKRGKEVHLGQDDKFQISSLAFNGKLFVCFREKDAFAMGVIEVEGFCRRLFGVTHSGRVLKFVRESSLFRLAITLPEEEQEKMKTALRDLVRTRGWDLYVGVELCCMCSQRAGRKFDWAMRVGHLSPLMIVNHVEPDKNQMNRIRSAIVIQALWRGFRTAKRFAAARKLLCEHRTASQSLLVEWQNQWRQLGEELYRSLQAVLEGEEIKSREMISHWEHEMIFDEWIQIRKSYSRIVLQSKGRYQAYRALSVLELRRLQKPELMGLSTFREEALTDVGERNETPLGYLLQAGRTEVELGSTEEPRSTNPVSVIRSRAEIAAFEESARFYMHVEYVRRWIEFREKDSFRHFLGLLNLPWDFEKGMRMLCKEQHKDLLAIIAFARQKIIIPTRVVPADPIELRW